MRLIDRLARTKRQDWPTSVLVRHRVGPPHSLPESMSTLLGLVTLDVSSNNLSGVIPFGISQGLWNSLQVLYLQNNLLTCPIPEGLSNCSNLISLDLSFNYLHGVIPSGLGSLSQFKNLIGVIPHIRNFIVEETRQQWWLLVVGGKRW